MSQYATLKAAIQSVIKQNGNNEITGEILQQALLSMINSLGSWYQFVGVADASTNPGTPDQKVFYIAATPGNYSNFGPSFYLNGKEVAIFTYSSQWSLIKTGIPTNFVIGDLQKEIGISTGSFTLNKLVSNAGAVLDTDGWAITNKFVVTGGETFTFGQNTLGYGFWAVNFYNENGLFVSQLNLGSARTSYEYVAQSGVAYVDFDVWGGAAHAALTDADVADWELKCTYPNSIHSRIIALGQQINDVDTKVDNLSDNVNEMADDIVILNRTVGTEKGIFALNKLVSNAGAVLDTDGWAASNRFRVFGNEKFTFSQNALGYGLYAVQFYDENGDFISQSIFGSPRLSYNYVAQSGVAYIDFDIWGGSSHAALTDADVADWELKCDGDQSLETRVKNLEESEQEEWKNYVIGRVVAEQYYLNKYISNRGVPDSANGWVYCQRFEITGSEIFTFAENALGYWLYAVQFYDENGDFISQTAYPSKRMTFSAADAPANTKFIDFDIWRTPGAVTRELTDSDIADWELVCVNPNAIEPRVDDLDQRVTALENADVEKEITVTLSTENKTVKILSELSQNYDVENSMYWMDDESYSNNPCANFGGTRVIRKTTQAVISVNGESDNISATGTNNGWIGANHGLYPKSIATVTGHGKTYADIGSKWQRVSDSKIFVLVQIVDSDKLAFISMYSMNDGIPTFSGNLVNGDVLSHNAGATHTAGMTVGDVVLSQWYPSENIIERKFYVDGKEQTQSGQYTGRVFDLVETYDVFNPASYLDILIANVGQLTQNPLPKHYLGQIDVWIRYANDYRFTKGGANVLMIDWIIMGKIGFTQFFPLDVKAMNAGAFGGGLQYYLPKALPLTVSGQTYDYRVPVPFAVPVASLNWTPTYWENPLLPPDRAIEFVDDGNKRIIGLHHGYIFDQGVASGANRKDYLTTAWLVYTSRASYNGALDSSKIGSTLLRGTHYGLVCFRKYEDYTDNPNGLISLSQFEVNGKYYIYADFEGSGVYNLTVPAKCQGKPIVILEKSNNVSVISSLGVSPILVFVESATPMYGYMVAEIVLE